MRLCFITFCFLNVNALLNNVIIKSRKYVWLPPKNVSSAQSKTPSRPEWNELGTLYTGSNYLLLTLLCSFNDWDESRICLMLGILTYMLYGYGHVAVENVCMPFGISALANRYLVGNPLSFCNNDPAFDIDFQCAFSKHFAMLPAKRFSSFFCQRRLFKLLMRRYSILFYSTMMYYIIRSVWCEAIFFSVKNMI